MKAIFLICGVISVAFVLFISVYLVISGIPAIRQIGLKAFLLGKTWAPTASAPSFGILPFILSSVYATAGAVMLGVPIGVLTAVFLSKVAAPRVAAVIHTAVELLAGIPSVVYGLVGMIVLVPTIQRLFGLLIRRLSAGGDRGAGHYDPAVDHQRFGDGAAGGAAGV